MSAYMPSSGTEGADFEAKWCRHCRRDEDWEHGDGCLLLANAYAGQGPKEWQMWRGDPVCSAFEASEPDYHPHLSGDAVADLFPGSYRRPTCGEQIRILVHSAANRDAPDA